MPRCPAHFTVEQRFWSKVNKNGPTPENRPDLGPCWIWIGAIRTKDGGYGAFGVKRGNIVRAHRYSYELLIGNFPKGKVADHLCRTPACVNPAHLEPVTLLENFLRGGGAWAIHRGDRCSKGHLLKGKNLGRHKIRGKYHRACLICRKATREAWRAINPDWRTRCATK